MENSHGIPPLQVLGLYAGDGALKNFQVPPLLAAHDSGLQAMAIARCPKKKNKDWACSWTPIADHLDPPAKDPLHGTRQILETDNRLRSVRRGEINLHDSAQFRELAAGNLRRGQALLRSNLINGGLNATIHSPSFF